MAISIVRWTLGILGVAIFALAFYYNYRSEKIYERYLMSMESVTSWYKGSLRVEMRKAERRSSQCVALGTALLWAQALIHHALE